MCEKRIADSLCVFELLVRDRENDTLTRREPEGPTERENKQRRE